MPIYQNQIIKNGLKTKFGNLKIGREWNWCEEQCKNLLKFIQKKPQDFVIATGYQASVKSFINLVSKNLEIKISWKGKGINEKAIDQNGAVVVACDKAYYRPLEVNNLLGDAKKAKKLLKWKPKYNLNDLVDEMISEELKLILNDK